MQITRTIRDLAASIALAAAVAAPAGAQTLTFTGTAEPSAALNGIVVGRYTANVAAPTGGLGSSIDIVCVDYYNRVWNGATWSVFQTSLGQADLSNTRFGAVTDWNQAGIFGSTFDRATSTAWNSTLVRYRAAAFLSEQMLGLPAAPASANDVAVRQHHAAIWLIMGAQETFGLSATDLAAAQTLAAGALNFAVGNAGDAGFWSRYVILSDVRMVAYDAGREGLSSPNFATSGNNWLTDPTTFRYANYVNGADMGFAQEFVTVVPEPEEIVLLGSGLALMGLFALKRRSA